MPDRRRILRQWREGKAGVLATLVRAEGSSYRRPGAHLLIGPDGECSGSISGGCLEAEVVRKAAWLVRAGAVVERYSTLFDDTAEIPYGLGCGGVVDLLIEPVDTPECRALMGAMEASLRGAEARVATWLPMQGRELQRVILAEDGTVSFASGALGEREIEAARGAVVCAEHATGLLPGDERIYVERLTGPQRLVVLGAGEDAKPVVTMAALLGWRVAVADGRAQLARAERFPEATHVAASSSIAELNLREADAVVVMTHSYEQDRAFLAQLLAPLSGLNSSATAARREIPGYIGLLGAAHRSSLLISEVAAALGVSVAACCERVWAPVGLDLGGDGPETIALAIISEAQAYVQRQPQGRLGVSRRLTSDRVADHIARGGAARYLQAQCALDVLDVTAK